MAALTTIPRDPLLDLDPWVGQRQASFRFRVVEAATHKVLGEITPLRTANMSHNTGQTIKRTLQLELGKVDTAAIDPVTDRISVFMVFPNGAEYPLGRFIFSDSNLKQFTSGFLGSYSLSDEMFLVDQEIRTAINGVGVGIPDVITQVVAGLPVTLHIENSPFLARESWGIGTTRGQILEALSVTGDYLSPWFDNNGILRFIRSFNPADRICDLDFDDGNKVLRENIVYTSDLLNAPNVIIATSNSSGDNSVAVTSVAFVSPNAPNSVARRGFEIPKTYTLQLTDNTQASVVAQGLAQRNTILEKVSLTTAPDPRHDSYNVIKWQNELWLELSWSMALTEGGVMNHQLRKAYLT